MRIPGAMMRSGLAAFLVVVLVTIPVQAQDAVTIPYTTAFGGDGETDGCPNTATLGLVVALVAPQTGFDWYNLCFGAPASSRVQVHVADDSGLPVSASMAVRGADGGVTSFWLCDGLGVFDLPAGVEELSVTLEVANRPHFPFYPLDCPVDVVHGTPTTGTVTVTYL